MNLKKLRTDRSAERDGVWKQWAPGVRVRIARVSMVSYEMLKQQKLAARASDIIKDMDAIKAAGDSLELLPPKIRALFDEIHAECLAELAVREWEGIEWSDDDDNDEPLPCTLENAILVLSQVSEFRDWVLQETLDRENYVPAAAMALVGNSVASSNGKSSSAKSAKTRSKRSATKGGATRSQPVPTSP